MYIYTNIYYDTDADAGGDTYRIFYSGGDKNRRGVGLIVVEEVLRSVMMVEPISERIIIMNKKIQERQRMFSRMFSSMER